MKSKKEIIEDVVKLLDRMDYHFLKHTYNIIKIMVEADRDGNKVANDEPNNDCFR